MRELPRGSDADVTSHGDLMLGNVLVSADGRLAGVLDVGGLGPADPALDLVGGWHLLNTAVRFHLICHKLDRGCSTVATFIQYCNV